MRLVIRQDYDEVSDWVGKWNKQTYAWSACLLTIPLAPLAHYIKERIIQFQPSKDRPFVLGLPSGSSPLGCYQRLAKFCKAGLLSFKHVITFSMDEYVGLPR
jgi:glucosamine-6-phosphate deaminase